jgi:formylglycine-generating enzyme required for sulfatase activity
LPADLGLKDALAALRRGQGLPRGEKILIVLDQFEQWLHASALTPTGEKSDAELVQALRQCDGGRVQCIVMVRDDFWMAVIRFMRELEIRLVEGQNSAAVDLFDLDHARKVLSAFGRAFGKLPEQSSDMTREQREFLRLAVDGLAQESKVISVRLALFAEMMKSKPWTPASLKAVGGTEGVGVTFLEETFTAPTAPPQHRLHQRAAQAVLKALLPGTGSDIKGHMRPHDELLAASGYAGEPMEFEELLAILDGDIRLITPTDPEGNEEVPHNGRQVTPGDRFYQLTHDYLVPSLRVWLTRKQKETRRGRAAFQLADRAAVWQARSENRQLPSLPQWISLRLLTDPRSWTEAEKRMMNRAGRLHAMRVIMAAGVVLVALTIGLRVWQYSLDKSRSDLARELVRRLLDADIGQVPGIIAEMDEYRAWTDPLLESENQSADAGRKLRTSLALLPKDPAQRDYLADKLLEAEPRDVQVIVEALLPHEAELKEALWQRAEELPQGHEGQRLRAACALARYDPENPKWLAIQDGVAGDLTSVPAVYLVSWMELLRPVRLQLLDPLARVFGNAGQHETQRSLATAVLSDYGADQPELIANLLMDSDPAQFAILYPRAAAASARIQPILHEELNRAFRLEDPDRLARRQANAAATLLKMDQATNLWKLFTHKNDPRVRSYLIHRLRPVAVEAGLLFRQLPDSADPSICQALLLALGEYDEKTFPPGLQQRMVDKLREQYRTANDAGLHSAAEWLLRHWGQADWLKGIDQEEAKAKTRQSQRIEEARRDFARDPARAGPRWYVNGQGQTLVIIPGPAEFLMGSPEQETAHYYPKETPHAVRIDRTFAIAAKSVTLAEFLAFKPDHAHQKDLTPSGDCPVQYITWYDAAAYCNWLSRQEGLPPEEWCYLPNQGKYLQGMKLAPDYLRRTGYRLPTEAEWEYACRAGTATRRYYGNGEDLLEKYAWYQNNSGHRTWPVGSLKPNDWGLFDMVGNLFSWCQERHKEYPGTSPGRPVLDVEDALPVLESELRLVRGGSYADAADEVRAARRTVINPSFVSTYAGLRVARTIR